jgi:hypothetical protein
VSELAPENRIESYPHWPLAAFTPSVPGRIERIYTHWSAYGYDSVWPAYHYCVAQTENGIVVVNTHDVRENMRNVYEKPDEPYAQHTRGRNSWAIGISMMAMQGATPEDFGAYPLTEELIDGLCVVGARLAAYYDIPIDAEHILSHAECGVIEGYFGTAPEQRWDIARLKASAKPLVEQDAIDVGEELRARMRAAR